MVIRAIRFVGGVAGLVAGRLVTTVSLSTALTLVGALILVHLVLECIHWKASVKPTSTHDSSLIEVATGFVAASGVLLGLVFAFAQRPVGVTLKVGVMSLASALLFSLLLTGILVQGRASRPGHWADVFTVEIAILFNLVLWALALGLLCVASTFIYQ